MTRLKEKQQGQIIIIERLLLMFIKKTFFLHLHAKHTMWKNLSSAFKISPAHFFLQISHLTFPKIQKKNPKIFKKIKKYLNLLID